MSKKLLIKLDMTLGKYKFFFLFFFVLIKFSFAFIYFVFYETWGLDYKSLYFSFCENYNPNVQQNKNLDILGFFFNNLFIKFCFLDKNIYFWVFVILQILIIVFALNKIIFKLKNKKDEILFLSVIFFSPTILLYSSAPTKDGFFILFICLSLLFQSKFSKNLALLFSSFFKPYFVIFYFFYIKKFIILIALIPLLLFLLFFFSDLFLIIKKKYLSFSITNILKSDLTNLIWLSEIFLIFFISFHLKIINRYLIIMLLILSFFASGYNLNVGSRVFITGILFLFSLNYVFRR